MAAFGLGIILAPILGPTLGGWITDNYSWRWIFYLNLPVGVISVLMISAFVHDPHYIGKHRTGSIDLWGIGFLALGFGMLQVVLDTGQRKDWFGSTQIRVFTFLCVFGLVALVVRELTTKHPIVDLRVLVLSKVWNKAHESYLATRPKPTVVVQASVGTNTGQALTKAA